MRSLLFILSFFIFAVGFELTAAEISPKKRAFFQKIVPVVNKVYLSLYKQYEVVKKDIETGKNSAFVERLKAYYGAKSNKDLLCLMKPHPRSIAIAQAAIESGWGSSRFFREANNIFGVWSTDPHQPRIAAGKKRGTHTIWLRKFPNLEAAVRQYYMLLSRKSVYRPFKYLNCNPKNSVYVIIRGLLPYSERKEAYVKTIASVIRHNKLTQYDTKIAKQR